MNYRRKLIVALGAGALATPLACFAQQQGKPVRVGILERTRADKYQALEKPFIDTLRELGWVEGRNVIYDRVYADDDVARLPTLAAALVNRGPNLIYTTSIEPMQAAFAKTRTIPIVNGSITDPVRSGFVASLAHPGGNVTGILNIGPELSPKRLQLLKQALPRITRVGVLVRLGSANEVKLIEQAAATLGVKVTFATMKQPNELNAAFASLAKNRIEAVLITHTQLFLNERRRIIDLAAKQRVPVIAHRSEMTDDGALMSYSSILTEQIRRAAYLADKVLKGTKPADIPVEQPTKFEMVVNMKTAKALGITIPGEIMLQATRVIE